MPLDSRILQQVEQTDLINYGLIPEFVGRFPIITALSVSTWLRLMPTASGHLPDVDYCAQRSSRFMNEASPSSNPFVGAWCSCLPNAGLMGTLLLPDNQGW